MLLFHGSLVQRRLTPRVIGSLVVTVIGVMAPRAGVAAPLGTAEPLAVSTTADPVNAFAANATLPLFVGIPDAEMLPRSTTDALPLLSPSLGLQRYLITQGLSAFETRTVHAILEADDGGVRMRLMTSLGAWRVGADYQVLQRGNGSERAPVRRLFAQATGVF